MLLEVARHAGRLVLALGVDDGDVAALGRKRVADALAEPAIAAGDDGDRTFQFHVFPPIDPAQEMPSSRAAVPPRMAIRCVVAQARRVEHEIDLGAGPRERVVGADHDLAGTGLGDQVAQRLGREHDGVEEELAVACR